MVDVKLGMVLSITHFYIFLRNWLPTKSHRREVTNFGSSQHHCEPYTIFHNLHEQKKNRVLLATSLVSLNFNERLVIDRAILDTASQSSPDKIATRLSLGQNPVTYPFRPNLSVALGN